MIPTEYVDVRDDIEVALKVDLHGAPSEMKCGAVAFWVWLRNVAEAGLTSALIAFEATQEHAAEGHAAPTGWMKSNCRMDGRDAARVQRNVRRARHLPLALEALGRGEISMSHLEVLAKAQREVGEERFAFGEETLVAVAIEKRFADFVHAVEYFVVRAAPRDAEAQARRNLEDRFASSSRTFGGNGVVDAQMEPIGFTLWDAELNRCMDFLYEKDRAEARDRLGRRPLDAELGRTVRQRRADAMVLMAERSAAYGDADLPPSRFTLLVHGDAGLVGRLIQFVLDDLAEHADDSDHEPDLGDIEYGENSLHELDDGTVVTVNTLLLALLTGTIRGVYFDPDGEVLRLSRKYRFANDAQRLATAAKYRRCCHPHGCDRKNPGLQADHAVEWDDGGLTDADNLQPLDGGHNVWKTNNKHRPHPPPDPGARRVPPDTGPLPR